MSAQRKPDGDPSIQLIGCKNIVIDNTFQSRVATDLEWCRELSARYLEGNFPPPIICYAFEGQYYVVSGFHRLHAAIMAKMDNIQCEIREGSREDALACSAGSNRGNGKKPMTYKDSKKSCMMLFENSWWMQRPATLIARHIGCGVSGATKWKAEFAVERGISIETVEGKNGQKFAANIHQRGWIRKVDAHGKVSWRDKEYYVGKDKAGQTLDVREFVGAIRRRIPIDRPDEFLTLLIRHGIPAVCPSKKRGSGSVAGVIIAGMSCVLAIKSHDHIEMIYQAVGRLMVNAQKYGPFDRLIVCGYDFKAWEIVRFAKAIGIEFMAPEELITSLKGAVE